MSELARFIRGEFDPGAFPHRDHVRMGYELLRRHSFVEAALHYSQALRAMLEKAGKSRRLPPNRNAGISVDSFRNGWRPRTMRISSLRSVPIRTCSISPPSAAGTAPSGSDSRLRAARFCYRSRRVDRRSDRHQMAPSRFAVALERANRAVLIN